MVRPNESDYSHLEAIASIFFPSTAPLVVHGVNVYGYGKIGDNATFTATIYGFDAEMNRDLNTMEVMATATVKGSEEVLSEGPTHTRLPRIQLQLRHSRRNTGYRRASRLHDYVQRLPFGRCRILRSPAVLHARPQRTMPRLHLQPYRRPGSHTAAPITGTSAYGI